MISARWLEKRKPYWDRLASIVGRSGRQGLGALSPLELKDLALLYRQAAGDFATIREDPTSERLAAYLNQLLARAHNLIYMGRPPQPGRILRFYASGFPQVFRATFNYTLSAFIVFLGAAVAGLLASLTDPAFSRFFLGAPMSDTIERREMWTHSIVTLKPLASSAIMTNNLAVSFSTFALGITAGIGTVYMLAVNGLLFGVISAACWQSGLLRQLLEFVAPHGVLELPSIFIAGGAGLLVARGLLFPGLLPRRDSLVYYGRQAARLVLGIIPLLFAAGVLEGFVSPSDLPVALKLAIATLGAAALTLYLSRCGRARSA